MNNDKLTNGERYAKEIADISIKGCKIGVDRESGRPIECGACNRCAFFVRPADKECSELRKEWYDSYYISEFDHKVTSLRERFGAFCMKHKCGEDGDCPYFKKDMYEGYFMQRCCIRYTLEHLQED